MTREQFKECLRKVEEVGELQKKLSDLGIETIDCNEIFYADDIFFEWVRSCFGKEGEELVSWWLYEEVDKIIHGPDGTETNVEDIDDLYSYLETRIF